MISVETLPIPPTYKEKLRQLNIKKLYPPQEQAIKAGLFDGKNLVLATPTASGKTLIAILATIKHITDKKGKVIYLVPLKALANEKYEEFKTFLNVDENPVKIVLSTGDYDDPGEKLRYADVIIATYEKMDSLLRHKPSWLNDVSLIIIDEIHYINSFDRGPTLEILITKLLHELSNKHDTQFIALSATITNVEDFQKWLSTNVILSNWRPVPLKEGVFINNYIIYDNGYVEEIHNKAGNPLFNLILNILDKDEQALIFVQRRRDAVSLAKKIMNMITSKTCQLFFHVDDDNERISKRILSVGEVTELSKILATLVRYKIGFHHAGLRIEHRKVIEDAFRKGYIKILTATPTLAAGVNLPARKVIITSLYRYELGYREPISIFEYKQMAGRAGRPQYDEIGEAIIVAKSDYEADYFIDYYINGKPENISSRLLESGTIDMHLLGLLAYKTSMTIDEIESFFSKTFCAVQYNLSNIKRHLKRSLKTLLDYGFITKENNKYLITYFGKRTAELYIHPITAISLKQYIKKLATLTHNIYLLLYSITDTPDSARAPLYSRDIKIINSIIDEILKDVIETIDTDIPETNLIYLRSRDDILQKWKTVFVLHDWIEEVSENEILRKWMVEPGDLQIIVSNAEWISYAASQIALLMGKNNLYSKYYRLSLRLKYGVKEDIIPLVMIPGIGRVRARALYYHGYKSPTDIKRASVNELIKVPGIGEKLAKKLLNLD